RGARFTPAGAGAHPRAREGPQGALYSAAAGDARGVARLVEDAPASALDLCSLRSPFRFAPGPSLNANRGSTIFALRAPSGGGPGVAGNPGWERAARPRGRADGQGFGGTLSAAGAGGRALAGGHGGAHPAPLLRDALA